MRCDGCVRVVYGFLSTQVWKMWTFITSSSENIVSSVKKTLSVCSIFFSTTTLTSYKWKLVQFIVVYNVSDIKFKDVYISWYNSCTCWWITPQLLENTFVCWNGRSCLSAEFKIWLVRVERAGFTQLTTQRVTAPFYQNISLGTFVRLLVY